MTKLSPAQVTAMLNMGDAIKANGGKRLADPAVNGRTLAVLEREGYIECMSDGTWRFKPTGRDAYVKLAEVREASIVPEVVDVPAADTAGVAFNHVIIWGGEAFVVEGLADSGRAKLMRFHGGRAPFWTDRPVAQYLAWGEVQRVVTNCAFCGPRSHAYCASCLPCDAFGEYVTSENAVSSPVSAEAPKVLRDMLTLTFPGPEPVQASFRARAGKRQPRRSRNRW